MTTEEIELRNLPIHLIEEIMSIVPLKSLIRLKSVSKSWGSFITRLRHSNPPITNSGLLVFLKSLNQTIFIKLEDHQSKINSSLLHNMPPNTHLIDSCNGLLLFATADSNSWLYHVSVPFSSQFTSLPPAHIVTRSTCASLAFNGGLQFSNFRVLCFFFEEFDSGAETLNYLCFSSNSWRWTEHQARLMNSRILIDEGFVPGQCFRPSVYMNEKMYWLWSIALLVYDENNEFFNLVKLPGDKLKRNIPHISQLIYQSEGQIHYCYPSDEKLYLWEYRGERVTCSSEWIFKKIILLDDLKMLQKEVVYRLNDADKQRIQLSWTRGIRLCAFNEDLQVLYFLVLPAGNIISYSFETKRFASIWSLNESVDNLLQLKIYPFLYNS